MRPTATNTNDSVIFAGEVQILFNIRVAELVTHCYGQDCFGVTNPHQPIYGGFYSKRKDIITTATELSTNQREHFEYHGRRNEFMMRNRIPPDYIQGILVQSEGVKRGIMKKLREEGISTRTIYGQSFVKIGQKEIPLNDFIRVSNHFKAEFWEDSQTTINQSKITYQLLKKTIMGNVFLHTLLYNGEFLQDASRLREYLFPLDLYHIDNMRKMLSRFSQLVERMTDHYSICGTTAKYSIDFGMVFLLADEEIFSELIDTLRLIHQQRYKLISEQGTNTIKEDVVNALETISLWLATLDKRIADAKVKEV